jgi:hypothetical protein
MSARDLTASLILKLVDRLSAPGRAAARVLGDIERAERMADRAGKQWGAGLDKLNKRLGALANASLVTDGLGRAGKSLSAPLLAATNRAIDFSEGLTGIGITAELTDAQLAPVRRSILDTAKALRLSADIVQGTYGAVLAEGVFRNADDVAKAGAAVARFQKLAEILRDPISNQEAGALSAALGSTFKLRADQLDQAAAMISKSGKLGGVGIGTIAKFLPQQAGQLGALSFANDVGLADLLAANQIAKRVAGSSEEAANNVNNLFTALARRDTIKNFSKIGVDLEAEIKKGVKKGVSPLETLAVLVKKKTGGDRFRIGELFGDVQATNAILALVQNLGEFQEFSRQIKGDNALPAYMADLNRATGGAAGSMRAFRSAQDRLSIASGTILAPALGKLADLVSRVADWFTRAEESGSPLAKAALWIASGFALVAVSAATMGNAVVGILGPWLIMKSIFGAGGLGGAVLKGAAANMLRLAQVIAGPVVGALRAAGLAATANPLGLVIAAIAIAVIAVALIIRKYWGPISAFVVGFARGLGKAFGPMIEALKPLKPLWDGIVGVVSKVWNWFVKLIEPVKASQDTLDKATSAGEKFGQLVGVAIMALINPLGTVFNLVKGIVDRFRGRSRLEVAVTDNAGRSASLIDAGRRGGRLNGPLTPSSAAPNGVALGGYMDNRTQSFTVNGGNHDTRSLARELDRLGRQGSRGALNDGAAG